MSQPNDIDYLGILTAYIRVCAGYQPKLGHRAKAGYRLDEFQRIYRADPFYNWLGLDNPLMYAAHKAAGGMTSIYRQIGIGCEYLFRRILQDHLGLTDEDVRWSYTLPRTGGKARKLHLDARILVSSVAHSASAATRSRFFRPITKIAPGAYRCSTMKSRRSQSLIL